MVDNHSDYFQLNEGAGIKLITGLFSFLKQSQTAPWIPPKQHRYVCIHSHNCHGAFDVSVMFVFILQSKGGILSKACDYIQELRQSNSRLGDELNNLERLRMDNQLLRQEVYTYQIAVNVFIPVCPLSFLSFSHAFVDHFVALSFFTKGGRLEI